MSIYEKYLNLIVRVIIDRPLGSKHPKYNSIYPINYGFIPGTKAEDGKEIDVFVLGVFEPVEEFEGTCIAIIHRADDNEDKLVVAPTGKNYTDEQINALVEFQERFFQSAIVRNPKPEK